jgi:hypothetical protein
MIDTKDKLDTHIEKAEHDVDGSSQEAGEIRDWTQEEERKLVWRIDLRVFPFLCFVFGLSLLDRTNISAAYIAGLAEDLELAVGARYNTALLVFFIGYALFELPSNCPLTILSPCLQMANHASRCYSTYWGALVAQLPHHGLGRLRTWNGLCPRLEGSYCAASVSWCF